MLKAAFEGHAVFIALYPPKDSAEVRICRWPVETLTHKERPGYEKRLEGLELAMEEIARTSELLRLMVEAIGEVIHLLPTWYEPRAPAIWGWSGSHQTMRN